MVQIRLLDGVSAVDETGEPVDIGPARSQAVLAALALSPGSVVSVSRLVAMVWGDDPPRTADKTLQSYITRLRKELGEGSIVRVGAAYRLEIDPAAVDVVRFQRLLDSGDVEAALAEWTLAPLEGLDAEGLAPAAQGLVEQWLGAVEVQLARQVDADPAAAIGRLTELAANHPFREGLCALLMTALYRVGRQADALAAYRTTRNHLVEELGVEPGPELRALEARILRQDEDLGTTRPGPRAGSRPTGTVTFGFADVEDFTRSWVTHRHESAAAMARYEQLVRVAAGGHHGHVFASGGGSFGVAFERPRDAAAWGCELQAAVRREPWPRGVEVRVRIGLHTGDAEEQGGSYFGPGVNLAACLAAAAHGGQALLSGTTAALLEAPDDLYDLGTYRLDGVSGDQRIFQLGKGDHPPVRNVEDHRRGNLPRRTGRLIGRHDDVRLVGEALGVAPVVTLVGPGGIGKTRLAVAAAQVAEADLDGGAWLVELARVAASSDVPRAVADTLEVQESPGRNLTQAAVTALRQRHALLVLDNCEHVLDAAAELVRAVVEGCPDVRVLVTSRERLGVPGERLITVGPLDPAGSGTELFDERATALDSTFDTRANRHDVEELCRRLDGVPLAIELAAARTRTMPPADLLSRLDTSLRLLTAGNRSGVEHHRSLRAAIRWSFDLLSPGEQALFRRLSRFVGPFDLPAAESLAAHDLDAVEVDELLGRLVDQSMVLAEPGPFGRRFRLLESMRQFGTEHLVAAGEDDAVAERHARWCVEQVDRIHQLLAGPAEIEGVARLNELWPNLRAAVDWAIARRDGQLGRALIGPLAAEVLVRSQTEIAEWAERILAIAPPDDHDLVVFALSLAARRYWRIQDREGFERLVQRYEAPDDPLLHHALALVYQDADALVQWCPQGAAALRRRGDDHLAQLSDIGLARALLTLGRYAEADEHLVVLAERYRRHGPPSLLSWVLTMLGYSAAAQGDRARADQLFDESAAIEVPDRTHSRNKPNEAMAAFRRGDRERALRTLRSDVEDLLENENVYDIAGTAIAFMSLMSQLPRYADAARIQGYLEETGLTRTPILRAVVTDAVERIATAADGPVDEQRDLGRGLDGRQALAFMRAVLQEVAADAPLAGSS